MTSTAPARRLTSPDLSPLTRSETDSLQADTRWRGAKAHWWVRRVSTTRIGRRMAVAAARAVTDPGSAGTFCRPRRKSPHENALRRAVRVARCLRGRDEWGD